MKKKKRIIIGLSIMCAIVICITLILITNKSSSKVLDSDLDNIKIENKVPSMFAIMLETEVGSDSYEPSTSSLWPGDGYIFNETLSRCENGGELTWHEDTRTVSLKTSGSDKCYLYFDVEPPDVMITTNNSYDYTPATPATLSCTNAAAEYNQKYGRIEISQINRPNKYIFGNCSLTYQAPSSKRYLNTYITSLAGQTQGDGQVVNENGYRYEGKNPNNYIWFNNELWRIIGVFDEDSHGQSEQNLVKIIRLDPIGSLSWSIDRENGTNDWTKSNIVNLLNGAYLNAQDGTDSGYCYSYEDIPSSCDYTNIGINSTYRNMIANVKWYLGGYSSSSATTEAFYNYERGTTVYSGRPTEWEGKIGLMYPSDYGYSVLASSCARTTNLRSYYSINCSVNNWLYSQNYFEMFITPNSSNSNGVFNIDEGGINNSWVINGSYVHPVLYLNYSVYIVNGNGTLLNPYLISI